MSILTSEETQMIGQRIADKRRSLGISQERFAELVGLTRAALGKIERGECVPKTDTLVVICRVLKTTPNDILMDTPSDESELSAMYAMLQTFTTEQKKQFYSMMNVVCGGILHPETGFLSNCLLK